MNRRVFIYSGLVLGAVIIFRVFKHGTNLKNYNLISWREYNSETGLPIDLKQKQYFLNDEAFLLDGYILENFSQEIK